MPRRHPADPRASRQPRLRRLPTTAVPRTTRTIDAMATVGYAGCTFPGPGRVPLWRTRSSSAGTAVRSSYSRSASRSSFRRRGSSMNRRVAGTAARRSGRRWAEPASCIPSSARPAVLRRRYPSSLVSTDRCTAASVSSASAPRSDFHLPDARIRGMMCDARPRQGRASCMSGPVGATASRGSWGQYACHARCPGA